jgi:hypothetical protein
MVEAVRGTLRDIAELARFVIFSDQESSREMAENKLSVPPRPPAGRAPFHRLHCRRNQGALTCRFLLVLRHNMAPVELPHALTGSSSA